MILLRIPPNFKIKSLERRAHRLTQQPNIAPQQNPTIIREASTALPLAPQLLQQHTRQRSIAHQQRRTITRGLFLAHRRPLLQQLLIVLLSIAHQQSLITIRGLSRALQLRLLQLLLQLHILLRSIALRLKHTTIRGLSRAHPPRLLQLLQQLHIALHSIALRLRHTTIRGHLLAHHLHLLLLQLIALRNIAHQPNLITIRCRSIAHRQPRLLPQPRLPNTARLPRLITLRLPSIARLPQRLVLIARLSIARRQGHTIIRIPSIVPRQPQRLRLPRPRQQLQQTLIRLHNTVRLLGHITIQGVLHAHQPPHTQRAGTVLPLDRTTTRCHLSALRQSPLTHTRLCSTAPQPCSTTTRRVSSAQQ
jgi:hypothetical protein